MSLSKSAACPNERRSKLASFFRSQIFGIGEIPMEGGNHMHIDMRKIAITRRNEVQEMGLTGFLMVST